MNENSVVVSEDFIQENSVEENRNERILKSPPPIDPLKRNRLFDSKGKNKQIDRDNIKRVIRFLEKNKRSITSSHDDWFRVAGAISNTFTYDVGRKFFLELCVLDGINHNQLESEKMILSAYQKGDGTISFSTIIYLAQQQGFDLVKAGIKNAT